MTGKNLFTTLIAVILANSAQADVVLTMGGDVNFNRNRMVVEPDGVRYGQQIATWESLTRGIKPLINGDLNFANIETVVTGDPTLVNQEKQFAFMSHTNSIRHLIDIGFNLFNLANNHAYDYGMTGLYHTMSNFNRLKKENPSIVFAGVDTRPYLLQPQVFERNGIRFAFASISIVDSNFQAKEDRPGLLQIRSDKDYRDLMIAFKKTKADYKMLSMHVGFEGQNKLDPGQQARFRYAIQYGGIDLIIGHHPHVIRPIEKYQNSLIFYSLGNYLMLGSADLTKRADINMDWGMFARLYLEKDPMTGKVKVDATEIIPLTNMHARTTKMSADKSAARIESLNWLSYDQVGDNAVKFNVSPIGGRGVLCADRINSMRAKIMCAAEGFRK